MVELPPKPIENVTNKTISYHSELDSVTTPKSFAVILKDSASNLFNKFKSR